MTTYTLKRAGNVFNEEYKKGKCGHSHRNTLEYEVVIKVKDLELDSRGFLVEHEDVHGIMEGILTEPISCENMAKIAKQRIKVALESRGGLSIVSIRVSIGEHGGEAMFTVEHWEPQERTLTMFEKMN